MELQRVNWLKKQLSRSRMRAIVKGIKSGMQWQMPWTDLPLGLSPGCSTGADLRNQQRQKVPSVARVAAGAFGFLTLIQVLDGPEQYGAFSFFETMPSKPIYCSA